MADRGEVKIRSIPINNLIATYEDAYKNIVKTILDETLAGKIRKARTLATIKIQLTELGVDVGKWAKKEIPQYYLDGANQALQDLKDLGVETSGPKGLVPINKEAIATLVDGTNNALAQGLTGISRNATVIVNDAIRQQLNFIIADGQLTGETLRTVRNAVKQKLSDVGLSALTDRAGREWSFDRYAEMLVRTRAVESRNAGLADKMLQNGYDLVQVSNHGSSHEACRVWEGAILSLTGKTKGYPTLQEAIDAGLFHPNCQHAINVLVPELAELTKSYNEPHGFLPLNESGFINPTDNRPYAKLQRKIEDAHNAGNSVLEKQLLQKIPQKDRASVDPSGGATAKTNRRLQVDPKTGKVTIVTS